jgi:signal peptidase I
VSYGDIVVISGEAGYDLIKSVIAVEGQTVELIDGKVYVDGEMLEESYAKGETKPLTAKTVWVLKEGEIFYLGDNRENSSDSRSSYDICSLEQIEGVICGWSLKLRPLNNFFFRFA